VSRLYPWGDTPPDGERANLDQRRLAPAPAGAFPRGPQPYGCSADAGRRLGVDEHLVRRLPGLQAFPYREYSEVFFGEEYRVLRGGSFATARGGGAQHVPQLGLPAAPARSSPAFAAPRNA
jgi:iron(II)-dependent oxidoreductase